MKNLSTGDMNLMDLLKQITKNVISALYFHEAEKSVIQQWQGLEVASIHVLSCDNGTDMTRTLKMPWQRESEQIKMPQRCHRRTLCFSFIIIVVFKVLIKWSNLNHPYASLQIFHHWNERDDY